MAFKDPHPPLIPNKLLNQTWFNRISAERLVYKQLIPYIEGPQLNFK